MRMHLPTTRHLCLLLCCLASSVEAAEYYECIDAAGVRSYQVEKCPDSKAAKRHEDAGPRQSVPAGDASPMTTQVVRAGLHYFGTGQINGVPFRMVVDTGATYLSMSAEQAMRAGIPLKGRAVRSQTANGIVTGFVTQAQSVSFAGQTVQGVGVFVQTEGKPSPTILLGMSFLRHFDVNMNGAVLSLTRK